MSKYPSYWLKAIKILSKRDKVLKRLILKYNDKFLTTRKDIFYSLCKSIIGQQISVAAANSVFKKFSKDFSKIEEGYLEVHSQGYEPWRRYFGPDWFYIESR